MYCKPVWRKRCDLIQQGMFLSLKMCEKNCGISEAILERGKNAGVHASRPKSWGSLTAGNICLRRDCHYKLRETCGKLRVGVAKQLRCS